MSRSAVHAVVLCHLETLEKETSRFLERLRAYKDELEGIDPNSYSGTLFPSRARAALFRSALDLGKELVHLRRGGLWD